MKTKPVFFLALVILAFTWSKPNQLDKIEFIENLESPLDGKPTFILNPLTIKTERRYDGLLDSNLYKKNQLRLRTTTLLDR